MQFKELATQEKAASDFTHMGVLTANDLTQATANTAQSFNVALMPVGSFIEKTLLRLVTPFKDASDAAYNSTTVDIGDTGLATRFATTQQVNENGTEISAPVVNIPASPTVYAASQYLTVNFNSMAAKSLNLIDVGELHVLVKINDSKKLSDAQPATGLTK
jgi:hypothetical protein